MSAAVHRNSVKQFGRGTQPMIFAHGYGCDQNMWRFVWPAFEETHRVVLFDHVGYGGSDTSQFDREKHATLDGYARDVLDIMRELDLRKAIFVGHSVSAIIGVLAAIEEPHRFDSLVLIGPSPAYINDGDYIGGFERADIEQLIETVESNYLGWSRSIAPVIMGNPERPELAEELANSFCRTNPEIAKQFARVTFLSDNRRDLPRLRVPALVLQCSRDVIAPQSVGEYVHRHLTDSKFVQLLATGHCPNLSAPEETVAAIQQFLRERG